MIFLKIERITKQLSSTASHIYAESWKCAYKNILPQKYLDELSYERWTDKLGNTGYDGFREDYILSDGGEYRATSSICAARDAKCSGMGEIMSLYVRPADFHKGYGRALFEFVTARLRENGFSEQYLWVLEENRRARAFYEAMRFYANGEKITQNIGGKDLIEIKYMKF